MTGLPNGPMIAAVENIRQAIIDCHYWTGEIYIDALSPPANIETGYTADELTQLRPFGLIQQAPGDGLTIQSRTIGGDCYTPQGHVTLQIELPVQATETNDHLLGVRILTDVGRMLWTGDSSKPGLLDLSGLPGRPFIRRVTVGDYGRVPAENVAEFGDYVACHLDLYWGING